MSEPKLTAVRQINTLPGRLVLVATGINVLGYMDRVCISVAAPALRSEFGYSPQEIGPIFGAFSLSYALFQAPWGFGFWRPPEQ